MGRETLTNLTAKFTQTTTPLTLIMGRFKVKIDFDALFLVGILSWNFLRNLQHIQQYVYKNTFVISSWKGYCISQLKPFLSDSWKKYLPPDTIKECLFRRVAKIRKNWRMYKKVEKWSNYIISRYVSAFK